MREQLLACGRVGNQGRVTWNLAAVGGVSQRRPTIMGERRTVSGAGAELAFAANVYRLPAIVHEDGRFSVVDAAEDGGNGVDLLCEP